ncbi:MAG: hypothetical protein KF703_04405 [Actinobacteria bacterium]|nr:hypothetical protein [Actinomycetota bacterium]
MARATVTGYCWPQSVEAGGSVDLHLSSSGGAPVQVEVARIGARREVVLALADVAAGDHEVPADAATHGCRWPVAASIPVDPAWPSGYYEVVLTITDPGGKARTEHAFFVVRPTIGAGGAPASGASILLVLATNTWHAYNDFGGSNLYTGATQVALDRPMARGYLHKPPGAGRRVTSVHPPDPQIAAHVGYLQLNHLSPWAGSAGWPDWEEPFVRWAEGEGRRFDVATNADLEEHPELLAAAPGAGYRLVLSVGHDEYWSGPMRDAVEAFIGRGGNVAFFSGNTAFWQVRMEGAPAPGEPNPTMVGFKGNFRRDPAYEAEQYGRLTSMWSDHLIARPENEMTGVSFSRGGYHRIGRRVTNGAGGYTVHRHDHWLFDGTGIGYGDVLGADAVVVGYECDGCDFTYRDGLPHPTHADGTPEGFTILATAPAAHFTRTTSARPPHPKELAEDEFIAWRLFDDRSPEAVERISHGHAVLGTYTSPAGGVVVTSGSTDWAHGLAGRDARVEQITRNVLDRLG